ncbi:hypothetical protein TRVL_05635 [Trypanosoma vivax]|nr:hypothetical protein TRVL_05635 [Trypanosoma vivax]
MRHRGSGEDPAHRQGKLREVVVTEAVEQKKRPNERAIEHEGGDGGGSCRSRENREKGVAASKDGQDERWDAGAYASRRNRVVRGRNTLGKETCSRRIEKGCFGRWKVLFACVGMWPRELRTFFARTAAKNPIW